ncbi:hypothetical protein GCM10007886_17610 [Methylobacterium gregans]|uniref:IS481 family transposase ISBxe4 n=2 Tax=Methylobacterium gregans TaxID=374424 RepID=A0AA37HS85_9HYPH|nr:IS481 family transposase [Methylobacterium gregans]GJD80634.1 IS481 family transposase ISBxe4 [Methylobacterium gregans]GLS53578.1 hypothetical protein GCM10007886_17610 [Methylobacterium gregans]
MPGIHPNARTTPAVRTEIATSNESPSVLARRYGVSTETIRKWRKRGAEDCQDRPTRPRKLPWKATEVERAMVCAVRRATGFPLDDLTAVITQFLPHLNRDAIYRILKAEGLNRLPKAERNRCSVTGRVQGMGRVRLDVTPLSTDEADNSASGRFLYVAVDHAGRCAHVALKDDGTTASAVGFLKETLAVFPSRFTHVLTDHTACFAASAFTRACDTHALEHRRTTRIDAPR